MAADTSKPAEKPRWASEPGAAVVTPPTGKQDLGWTQEIPPHQFFNWLSKYAYEWINYLENRADNDLGGAAPTTLTITGGSITATMGHHIVDTEGAAATDELTHIDQTNLADGRLLIIRSAAAGRVITVKNNVAGVGRIFTSHAGDVVLDSAGKYLVLMRTGSYWTEVTFVNPRGTLRADAGTPALPSITFMGDQDTGFLNPSGNLLGVTIGGVERFRFGTDNTLSAHATTGGMAIRAGNQLSFLDFNFPELSSTPGNGHAGVIRLFRATNTDDTLSNSSGFIIHRADGTSGSSHGLYCKEGRTSFLAFGTGSKLAVGKQSATEQLEVAGKMRSDTEVITPSVNTVAAATPLNIGSTTDVTNIGKAGGTVNILGAATNVQTTNSAVVDKNVTLNSGGAASTGDGSGISVEENGAVAGRVEVGNTRSSWDIKAPARSGVLRLTPPSAAFNHEIISSATAARTLTLSDATGTVALVPSSGVVKSNGTALSASAVSLASGSTEITGTLAPASGGTGNATYAVGDIIHATAATTLARLPIGTAGQVLGSTGTGPAWVNSPGAIPLGAVIATFPNLTGAYNCTATTAADAAGFVQCAGQTIADATSTMNGVIIPNLNNDVFVMGNVTAGTAGGANAMTLAEANLPSHSHNIMHKHDIRHAHGIAHRNTLGYIVMYEQNTSTNPMPSGSNSNSITDGAVTPNTGTLGTFARNAAAANYYSSGISAGINGTQFSATPTTETGTFASGTTGSGTAFNNRPSYITGRYIMRIK